MQRVGLVPAEVQRAAKWHVPTSLLRSPFRERAGRVPLGSLSQKLGRCALLYSAGLFDYLEDRTLSRLVSVLFDALTPGGLVAVGNVAAHNPSRWIMEYFTNWFVVHRAPADLLRLAADLRSSATSMTVDSEPTGVNLFLRITRQRRLLELASAPRYGQWKLIADEVVENEPSTLPDWIQAQYGALTSIGPTVSEVWVVPSTQRSNESTRPVLPAPPVQ